MHYKCIHRRDKGEQGKYHLIPGTDAKQQGAHFSRASVQDVVSNALVTPNCSSRKPWNFLVKGPSPQVCAFPIARRMYSKEFPAA